METKFSPDQKLNENEMWDAVLGRDRRYDGRFFYGVLSTRIYCRPHCPSKKPGRENTVFFLSADSAAANGFRPCKRCAPDRPGAPAAREKVTAACRYIESCERLPALEEIAQAVFSSPSHLHRQFKEALGISPRDYAEACRQSRFSAALQRGEEVALASYEAGYGSPSRVYEKAAATFGMTPKTYKKRGEGQTIRHAVLPCPLGFLLVAATGKGICSVRIGDSEPDLLNEFRQEFRNAELREADQALSDWAHQLIEYLSGTSDWPLLPYDIQATAFQKRVWDCLRSIPSGTTLRYHELAEVVGNKKACRAVASACASNPAALVIPCHRVVPAAGGVGGYRWSPARKQKLLELEKGKTEK